MNKHYQFQLAACRVQSILRQHHATAQDARLMQEIGALPDIFIILQKFDPAAFNGEGASLYYRPAQSPVEVIEYAQMVLEERIEILRQALK